MRKKIKNYNFKFKKIKFLILIQIKNIISNYFLHFKLIFLKNILNKEEKMRKK